MLNLLLVPIPSPVENEHRETEYLVQKGYGAFFVSDYVPTSYPSPSPDSTTRAQRGREELGALQYGYIIREAITAGLYLKNDTLNVQA